MHTTFGSTLEASSGFASLTCYDDQLPVISGRNLNYPDQIVCLYAAGLIAGQVLQCRTDGEARQIDVSQRDCAVFQAGDVISSVSTGVSARAEDVRERSERPEFSTMLKCADDAYIAVSCEDLSKSGAPWQDKPSAQAWAQTLSSEDCLEQLDRDNIGAVLSRTGDMLAHVEAYKTAGIFMRSPNGDLVKGTPFQFQNHPMTITSNSPQIGEHNDDILS